MKIPEPVKLPSGSWRVRVQIDGKQTSITRMTKEECKREAILLKYGGKEQKEKPLAITLAEAYRRYIDAKDGTLSPSTIAGYKRLSHNTFQNIMPVALMDITQERIQREVSAMSRKGLSPKYIANASGLLSAVMKFFDYSYTSRVSLPQKQKYEKRMLTEAEIDAIISAARGTDVELPILMALWMGMRMSEIRGARVEDIKDGRLHIQRAIVTDFDGEAKIKPPKTFSGDRYVNVPFYIESLITQKNGYIVEMTANVIYKHFQNVCASAGVEHCRFHDLRSANAGVMIRLGISSKYAQQRNGWSSDRMYKEVYGYTMPDMEEEVDKRINDYFATKLPQNP